MQGNLTCQKMQLITVREILGFIFNVANRNYLIDNHVPVLDHPMAPVLHVLLWLVLILLRKKPENHIHMSFFLFLGKFKL